MRDQAQHHDRMSPRNQEVFDYLMKNQYDNTFPKHEHQQPQIIETTIPKHINQNAFDKSRMHDAASIATGASTRTGKTAITSATSSSHHKEDEHGPLQDLVLQSLSESLSVEHPPSEAMNPMINETRTLPKNTDVNNSCASDSAAGHPYPQEDMDRTLLDQSQVQPSVPSMLHKLGGFFKNPISCGDEVVSPLKNTDANGNVKSNSNKSSSSKRTPKSADESQERIAILEASLAQKTREIEKLLKLQELVVTENKHLKDQISSLMEYINLRESDVQTSMGAMEKSIKSMSTSETAEKNVLLKYVKSQNAKSKLIGKEMKNSKA